MVKENGWWGMGRKGGGKSGLGRWRGGEARIRRGLREEMGWWEGRKRGRRREVGKRGGIINKSYNN